MKVSYEENSANYFGLQRRGGLHTETVLSVRAKGNAGQPLSSRPKHMNRAPLSCADPVLTGRRQHRANRLGKVRTDTAESTNLCMRGNSKRENREVLLVSVLNGWQSHRGMERSENTTGGKSDMNADRNSDESVVPSTSANNEATEDSSGRRRWCDMARLRAGFGGQHCRPP